MKTIIKTSILLTYLMLIFYCSCDNATNHSKIQQHIIPTVTNINGQKKVYQSKNDTNTLMKLNHLDTVNYYFELIDRKNNTTFLSGLFSKQNNKIEVLLRSSPLLAIKIEQIEKNILSIEFPNQDQYNEFQNCSGEYNEIDKDYNTIENFSVIKSPKWQEIEIIKDSIIKIYPYPLQTGNYELLQLRNSEYLKIYDRVFKNDSSIAFLFIKLNDHEGWINLRNSNVLGKSFKCEQYNDGTIEKDNRKEKYLLYTDTFGKLLRKEKY